MNIQFHHVTKTIHGNRVIDDVSMELCSGTVVGLRGINGSGKTMLLRLLAGLIYPSSGTITVDDAVLGKTISSVEKEEKAEEEKHGSETTFGIPAEGVPGSYCAGCS